MFRFPQIQFENFSFILGILFAGLLFWVIIKLRDLVKKQRAEKEPDEVSKMPVASFATCKRIDR